MGTDLRRVIVVDLEATCWETREEQGVQPNEIIEIGACELVVKTGKIDKLTSIAVAPRFTKITPFCEQLTGWTQAAIDAEGLDIAVALSEFDKIFQPDETTIWASFGEYDRWKLSNTGSKGLSMYEPSLDLSKNPFSRMRSHMNVKTLMGLKYKLGREMGLGKALHHIGEKFEGRPHNGGDDSYNIAKVLRKVLA